MEEQSDYDILVEFQNRLLETYRKEDLKSIIGLDDSCVINGENVLASYMNAMRKGQQIYRPNNEKENPKFDYNRLRSDLFLISDEILHFTGLTCIYSYYLSSPLDSPINFYGEIVYTNNQTLIDKRFFMYAACAFEKVYNYWDRIGDLLASFFPEIIKPSNVYFAKMDKVIPISMQDNVNVKWLIDFKENQFSGLNKIRKDVVHYENLDTTFASEHLSEHRDRNRLEILVNKRLELIPNLKSHIDLTLEGFQRTIRVMEFLNEEVLTDEVIKEKRQAVNGAT